jgi:hypothetical protein
MNRNFNIIIPREFYESLSVPYPPAPSQLELQPSDGCYLIVAVVPKLGISTCVAAISNLAARALAAEIAIFAAANNMNASVISE